MFFQAIYIRKGAWCLLGFLLFSSPLLALSPERVKERFPLLHEAVDFAFQGDTKKLERFFETWSDGDLDFALDELQTLIDLQLSADDDSRDAFRFLTSRVKGVLGEIHGIAYLRKQKGANDILATDTDLRRLTRASRPDAILYEIRGSLLVVKAVFESKVHQRKRVLDWPQIKRYFGHWQADGLTLYDAAKQQISFAPENIRFESGTESSDLATMVSAEGLSPYLYYLATERADSPKAIEAPTDFEGFDRIAFRLATVVPGNAALGPEQRRQLETEMAKARERRQAPLVTWMRMHQNWPRQPYQSEEEKRSEIWIGNNGGRAHVFKTLPPDVKAFYEVRLDSDAVALLADFRLGQVKLTPEQLLDVRMVVEPFVVISEWLEDHDDHWPSAKAEAGSVERRLGQWINKKNIAWVYTQLPERLRNRFAIRAQVQGPEMLADHRAGRLVLEPEAVMTLRLLHEAHLVLNEWMREHRDWPRANGEDATPTERRLGQYVNSQGSVKAVYPTLDEDVREIEAVKIKAEARAAGRFVFRAPMTSLEVSMAKEPFLVLTEWMRENKCWPRSVGDDTTEKERKLGNYVGNSGGRPLLYAKLPEDVKSMFAVRLAADGEAYLRDWEQKKVELTEDQLFELRFQVKPVEVVTEWMRAQKRWPGSPGKGVENREGRLGTYCYRSGGRPAIYKKLPADLKREFKIRVEVDAAGILSDHLSGKSPLDDEKLFDARWAVDPLDAIAHLMRQNSRWPRSKIKGQEIPERESRSVGWIGHHGSYPGVFPLLPQDVRAMFEVRLPVEPKAMLAEYRAKQLVLTPEQLIQVMMAAEPFETLVGFLRAHRRWPRQKAEDSLEAKLGTWISANGAQSGCFAALPEDVRALPLVRLNVEGEALWADIQAGSVRPTESELFEVRMKMEPLNMLFDWMEKNGRWPKTGAKSGYEERRLGGWVGHNGKRSGISKQLPTQLFYIRADGYDEESCAAAVEMEEAA